MIDTARAHDDGRLRAGADLQPGGARRSSTRAPPTGATVAGTVLRRAARRSTRASHRWAPSAPWSAPRSSRRTRTSTSTARCWCPGIGAQGGTADDVRRIFGAGAAPACCPRARGRSSAPGPTPVAAPGRTTGRSTPSRVLRDGRDDAARSWRSSWRCCCRVAGCGEEPHPAYCDDLGTHRRQMADMLDSTSPDALLSHLSRCCSELATEVAHRPPGRVADLPRRRRGPPEGAEPRRTSSPTQFVGGKPPAGLSAADRAAIVDAADQLSSDDVVTAASGIEQEARDVCKINLGL